MTEEDADYESKFEPGELEFLHRCFDPVPTKENPEK